MSSDDDFKILQIVIQYVRDFNLLTNSETLFIIYTLLPLVNTSVSESHWLGSKEAHWKDLQYKCLLGKLALLMLN